MPLPDPLAELDRRYRARLERALAELRAAVEARARRAGDALVASLGEVRVELPGELVEAEELATLVAATRPPAPEDSAAALHETAVALDVAATQGEMLEALLAGARRFAPRAAIWLTRDTGLVGWGSAGFAGDSEAGDPVAGREASWGDPALADLAAGRGAQVASGADAAATARALGAGAAAQTALVPLVLRDHVAAALFAARREEEAELSASAAHALQLLALLAAQRLELAAQTGRSFTPTLYRAAEIAREGLPLWSAAALVEAPPATAAPAVAEPAAPEEVESPSWSFEAPEAATEPAAPELLAAAPPAPSGIEELFAYEPTPLAEPQAATAPESEAARPEPATWSFEAPAEGRGASWEMPAYEPGRVFELEPEPSPLEPEPAATAGESPAPPEPPLEIPEAEEAAWALEEAPAVEMEEPTLLAPAAEPERGAVTAPWSVPSWATSVEPIALPAEPPEPEPLAPSPEPLPTAAESLRLAAEPPPIAAEPPPIAAEPPPIAAEPPPFPPEPPPIPAAAPPPALEPLPFAATREVRAPEPAGGATPIGEEDATVLMRRPAPAAEPAPPTPLSLGDATRAIPIVRPAPPPPIEEDVTERTAVRGGRTTEVAPPPDIQGPGLAFTSSRQPRATGENALHDEARRLARLLVSEIKLYNEEQVEEGRRHRDLYLRLREDIDRSRQIYEERVHDSVRGTTDYFQQELVRSLAGGDPRALGI